MNTTADWNRLAALSQAVSAKLAQPATLTLRTTAQPAPAAPRTRGKLADIWIDCRTIMGDR